MPELPEVQTVINNLSTKIINQIIYKINIYYPKLIKNSNEIDFTNYLVNNKFISIDRRGKYLIFNLTNNKSLIIHLRMEGKLFAQNKDSKPNFPQLLAEFVLDNCILRYYDTRKFGTFEIIDTDKITNLASINKLGIDALDNKFDSQYLYKKIANSKIKIKTILLDQTIVSGIGNIYANEILYAANINPFRLANSLNLDEVEKIVINTKLILNESIKHCGTTIHSFKSSDDLSGGYQKFLKVHGKKNQSCCKCNNKIKFDKINQRGTYYCSFCQK